MAPGLGDALQARGDVDGVAHEIAVALLDDVADVNADPKHDPTIVGNARVAIDHGVLHFHRAAHRIDRAAELDEHPIASTFEHAPVMHGDGRID